MSTVSAAPVGSSQQRSGAAAHVFGQSTPFRVFSVSASLGFGPVRAHALPARRPTRPARRRWRCRALAAHHGACFCLPASQPATTVRAAFVLSGGSHGGGGGRAAMVNTTGPAAADSVRRFVVRPGFRLLIILFSTTHGTSRLLCSFRHTSYGQLVFYLPPRVAPLVTYIFLLLRRRRPGRRGGLLFFFPMMNRKTPSSERITGAKMPRAAH